MQLVLDLVKRARMHMRAQNSNSEWNLNDLDLEHTNLCSCCARGSVFRNSCSQVPGEHALLSIRQATKARIGCELMLRGDPFRAQKLCRKLER